MGSPPLKAPHPLAYPSEPHVRRHGPQGYPKHRLYLNWLRDEFYFRCVYCLRRETWLTLRSDWQIDHFVPKSIHPGGTLDYDNLVYACANCNHSKAAYLAPDPCKVAYGRCVEVDDYGRIRALDGDGVTLIEAIGLDDEDYIGLRVAVIDLLRELPEGGESYCRFFGFPKDLPDLSKERTPPGGNKRPDGIMQSCFEKARRSELPAYY